jgi:DNA-binding protein HU-beta
MIGKSDIAQQVAQRTGLPRSQATKAVDAMLQTLQGALSKGDEVRLTGFGSWRVSETKARKGRNPRTGAAIDIAAGKRVSFRPGSKLVDSVRGGGSTGGGRGAAGGRGGSAGGRGGSSSRGGRGR